MSVSMWKVLIIILSIEISSGINLIEVKRDQYTPKANVDKPFQMTMAPSLKFKEIIGYPLSVQKSTGINLIELSKYKSTLNPKVKPKIVETRFDTSLEPSRRAWKKVSAEASAESKEINNVEEVLQSKLYPVKKTTTQKDTSVQEDSGEVTDTDVEATTIGKSYRRKIEEDKEENTKIKIKALAKKTVDDALRQLESISSFQEQFHLTGPYKAGFLLSMLHKCRDDLNELFNVAVKYKDEYEALDHLRIFELVVHTNLDMTNLVRQLMKYTNGTTETMQKQIMWPQPAYDI